MRLRTPTSGGSNPPVRRTSQTPSSSDTPVGFRRLEAPNIGAGRGAVAGRDRSPDRAFLLVRVVGVVRAGVRRGHPRGCRIAELVDVVARRAERTRVAAVEADVGDRAH